MTRPLPPIAPCPFCGGKPTRFVGLCLHAVACLSKECGVQPCAAADEKDNTPACAAKKWNRRDTAEAERRGAMAVVAWFADRGGVITAKLIEQAIERGEVLPAAKTKARKR